MERRKRDGESEAGVTHTVGGTANAFDSYSASCYTSYLAIGPHMSWGWEEKAAQRNSSEVYENGTSH